jgi:NitT/TauT family transport system ATP-binding protein
MESAISIKNLEKSYEKEKIKVFSNFNLEVKEKKIIAIFGPNGSGKTTLFEILAGIKKADKGEISFNEKNHSKLSYMFQNYSDSLLPWRKNFDNLALPLQIKGIEEKQIKLQIKKIYEKYGFNINLDSYPYELSGGQKQFLAFLRSIITEPSMILLDEPFSALDYENNIRLRNKLQEYYLSKKPTILVITHDIEEAVYLAEEIVVLSNKPSKILGIIKNDLPYPRKVDILESEKFNKIKSKVLDLFRSEVKI